MATYTFETITAAQALAYSAATDSLVFTNPTSHGAAMAVLYNAATATSPATVTLVDSMDGHSVVFSTAIEGEGDPSTTGSFHFPDGSNVYVGMDGPDSPVAGTAFGDGLFGGAGDDTLNGGDGNDLLQGNQGNDSLAGGAASGADTGGDDTIFGGQGNDYIDLGGGRMDFAQGNLGDDTITGTAVATMLGGQGDDVISDHGPGGSVLSGDRGNDTITGSATGGDSIAGVIGNDSIASGSGNDTVDGGDGNDTISDAGGSNEITGGNGNDSITLTGGHVGFVSFVEGDAGDDTIDASAGGGGTLSGGLGDDLLVGGAGNETLSGDDGNDTVMGGSGASLLQGGNGDDDLEGGAGNDTINTGDGSDTVRGGAGADSIVGGSGTDFFTIFPGDSPAQGGQFDTISGWHKGDHLSLAMGPSNALNFVMVQATATDFNDALAKVNTLSGGSFYAIQVNGDLMVFADTNHDSQIGASDTAVLLVGKTLADIDVNTII